MAKDDGRNVSDVIGVAFELDTTHLRKGVREASNLIKGIKDSTNAANAGMDNWKKSTEGLTNKLSELTKVQKIQQQVVDALKEQYEELSEQYGENSERAIRAYRSLAKWEAGLKRTQVESESYAKQLKRVSAEYDNLEKHSKRMERGVSILRGVMINLVTDGIRAVNRGIREGVSAAIEYEASFKDVQKTVNGTLTELIGLSADLRSMATVSLPKTADSLAQIAAIGGQLGIPVKNLAEFTRIMTQLGDATNVTAEQAALLISKIGAQTGLDPSEYGRFASALVALGNNFATTEDKILDMTNRIASSGAIVGATEQQLLALATALSATGAEAEAGGTALTRLFKRFQIAVETQNEDLPKLAKVAGLTSEQFRKLFGNDAIGALLAFTRGLADMDEQGISVAKNLADLGITEVRLTETIQKLVLNEEGVERALKISNEAWDENTALSKEAETRYDSLASKLQFAKNQVKEFGIAAVENLGVGSVMEGAVTMFDSLVQSVTEAIDPLQKVNRLLAGLGDWDVSTDLGKSIAMYDAIEAYETAGKEVDDLNNKLNKLKENRKATENELAEYGDDPYARKGILADLAKEDKQIAETEAKIGAYLSKQIAVADVLANQVVLTDEQVKTLETLNPLLAEAYEIHKATEMVLEDEEETAKESAKFSADSVVEKYKSAQTRAQESIKALKDELAGYEDAMSKAVDADSVDEYKRAIDAVTSELERQQEQYEKIYGEKEEAQEEAFLADQIILKYGSDEEKSLVRQKQLQTEIDRLLKEQADKQKKGVENTEEYTKAVAVLKSALAEEQAPKEDKPKEDEPGKLDPTGILARYGTDYEKTSVKIDELKKKEEEYRKEANTRINEGIEGFEEYNQAADALKNTWEKLQDSLNKTEDWWEKPLSALKRYRDKWGETVDFIGDQIKGLIDTNLEYQAEGAQNQLDIFRKEKEAEEEELDKQLANGSLTYSQFYTEKEKLEKKNNEKELALTKEVEEKKKAIWIANQINQATQAFINGAVAVTKAYAELGPVAGSIAAVGIGALTLGQITSIATQQYQVPALAKGGVVDKPTYALVGEAGKEAVMPLENNTGWIDELAGKLVIRMEGGNNVSDSHNKDYQITQNIYAKTTTRREMYKATRRAIEC